MIFYGYKEFFRENIFKKYILNKNENNYIKHVNKEYKKLKELRN